MVGGQGLPNILDHFLRVLKYFFVFLNKKIFLRPLGYLKALEHETIVPRPTFFEEAKNIKDKTVLSHLANCCVERTKVLLN